MHERTFRRRARSCGLPNRLTETGRRIARRHQQLNLPQLGNYLLRLVALLRHLQSSFSAQTPYSREDHFSGGRPTHRRSGWRRPGHGLLGSPRSAPFPPSAGVWGRGEVRAVAQLRDPQGRLGRLFLSRQGRANRIRNLSRPQKGLTGTVSAASGQVWGAASRRRWPNSTRTLLMR
jgi:hypothetical protein